MTNKLTEEDWEIVKHRVETMPAYLKLAMGKYGQLSKDEMIRHIDNRDEIGRRIVEIQLNYLRFFKKEMERLANV